MNIGACIIIECVAGNHELVVIVLEIKTALKLNPTPADALIAKNVSSYISIIEEKNSEFQRTFQ